jgi:uncharacterized protein YgbK (DUF1537 family)
MDLELEKLKKQAEALKDIDVSKLTTTEFEQLIEQVNKLVEDSEQSLINTTLIEINQPTNNE